MNTLKAIEDTLQLAREHGMDNCDVQIEGCNYSHLADMYSRIVAEPQLYSEGKLNRWLGWIQGVVVATDFGTLEQMKEINKRNAG